MSFARYDFDKKIFSNDIENLSGKKISSIDFFLIQSMKLMTGLRPINTVLNSIMAKVG